MLPAACKLLDVAARGGVSGRCKLAVQSLSGAVINAAEMKAIRLIQPGRALELQEVPVPAVGPCDVLVRVKAAGICHSDAHYRAGKSVVRPLPLTLGHEVAGVVERAGGEVTNLKAGDRICLHYLASCGECVYCQRGNE